MTISGWEKLDCPYFADTCRLVLGERLSAQGLIERGSTPGGGLIFSDGRVTVELNYDVIRYPKYYVTIWSSLGDWDQRENGVPLWFLLAADHPYRKGHAWHFASNDELLVVLGEIEDEFMMPIWDPLLKNTDALRRLVDEFHLSSTGGM